MAFFRNLTDSLGFTAPKADAYSVSPEAYSDLYQSALRQFEQLNNDQRGKQMEFMGAIDPMLGDLQNNMAGRKKNFQEDMARGFQADTQNLARARGGTGTLAQALKPSGEMYGAQARARARGLNDLYSQGIQDLSGLQNVQQGVFDQQGQTANSISNIFQKELASRRGQANTNTDNAWNIKANQGKLLGSTVQGAAKAAASSGGGGGG